MNNLVVLNCHSLEIEETQNQLLKSLEDDLWVHLSSPLDTPKTRSTDTVLPRGSGVLIGSSGSSGGRQLCLQPVKNLDQSAWATGEWLRARSFNPSACTIFNPLPFHHVSGFMPWWRSRCWGSNYFAIDPALMRSPEELYKLYHGLFKTTDGTFLLSLVPTQLARLLSVSVGIQFLKSFDVIWVGGAHLSKELATISRAEGIRLSPCYGATETAAMVTALPPKDFLSGISGCGRPLCDVELRIAFDGALQVRTSRIALARWTDFGLQNLRDIEGWWDSADLAHFVGDESRFQLEIEGRKDSAFQSGGETIFPEQLEERFIQLVNKTKLSVKSIMFLPLADKKWGNRVCALINLNSAEALSFLAQEPHFFVNLVKDWHPAERPIEWLICRQLSSNLFGKLDRNKWTVWVEQIKEEGKLDQFRLSALSI